VTAYVTQSDLVERYGTPELAQLTDQTAATMPDATEIGRVCDETTSLIDAYLSARYTVPLSPVPTVVRAWACIIARKLLWKDRALADSAVMLAYNDAMSQLKDAGKGRSSLPDATGKQATVSAGVFSTSPTPVFNTDGLLDFRPSVYNTNRP